MKKKADAHDGLSLLFARDGVPSTLIMDGSKEQTMGMFRKKASEAACHVKQTEPYSPWQNAAERSIRELKKAVGRKMMRSKAPRRLWDYCLELESYIRSHTAHDIFELKGEVPETMVMGETPDISQFAHLGWYEWVKFRDQVAAFPDAKLELGRYLGPSIDVGPAMTCAILKKNGEVVHRSTVRSITPDEKDDPEEVADRQAFDVSVKEKLGPELKPEEMVADDIETPSMEAYADDDDGEEQRVVDEDDKEQVDEPTPHGIDAYLNAEVLLPIGGQMRSGSVRARVTGPNGEPLGRRNNNPILDTRQYEVEFPDGTVSHYSANVIAENMYAQCDAEGNQFLLLDDIVDYKKDGHAVAHSDRYVHLRGRKKMRKTTKGWHLCVQWKDGTTTWERLADLKESNPVQVAEYAVSQGIDHEPAFAWWVPFTLKKRDRIIASVNARYLKTTHKFGIRVPKTVLEAIEIDRENGNTMWQDAIQKEMNAVRIAFKVLEADEEIPPGYQNMKCHMIFTVKMEDFRRKARYVAGGHMTEAPAVLTYASVVSRESVRIALTLAALNDLEVKTSDIMNAYLTAPVTEKIWCTLGPEWGPDAGKRAIIVRALYGLKSAGAAFRNHLADCMRTLGYKPCKADGDLWYKPETRPDDGHAYYSYVLLYVDDCLCIHHDAVGAIKKIDKFFKMKDGSIGDPDVYLGAKLKPTRLNNGVTAWGMSASKYVQEAVANVEKYLAKEGLPGLVKKALNPFPTGYTPELDESRELNPTQANLFQSHIGILRWMVELGRVDIMTEVSTLSSHLAMPREGHQDAVYHIFAYLKRKHNARMIFDPSYPVIDMSTFKECDWRNFYGEVKEPIPFDAPEPRGKVVDLRLFVDSSHADDRMTRRSRSGHFVFLNMAPISWLSKKQPTIETSVFGAEFVAMKIGIETVRGIRYKLRMMGVPLDGPTFVYGDNMSVIHNTQRPESTLKKKSNSICYHAVRESVAMGESLTGHVSTHDNPADLTTKILPGGRKRDHLTSLVLYDIADF